MTASSSLARCRLPVLSSLFAVLVVAVTGGAARAAPAPTAPTVAVAYGGDCSGTSIGLTPLTDIGDGELYDDGNDMPESHAAVAPDIVPIDGVIGVASLGMSNGFQEWEAFIVAAAQRDDVNEVIRLANGAVSGQTMAMWSDPDALAWDVAVDRIRDEGLEPEQVQVVWLKMGSRLGELPGDQANRVALENAWLHDVLDNAVDVFPNLKQVYASSRIYAGYSANPNHSEPQTGYDNGVAVRSLVADAVSGGTPVWTAWGPYLWADGLVTRGDGLTWECDDFENDGVHPSFAGEDQVASLLLDFFTTEPVACAWFVADGATGCGGGGATFQDVPAGHTFFADIEWLAASQITLGCNPPANDAFCPADDVTRGQMAAFLTRALDLSSGPDAFEDDDGSVFEADIDALAAAEITQGCNPPANDRFCPYSAITRGQMAAFLTRALGLPPGPDVFTDDEESVFEADIDALAAAGMTLGCNPPANDEFCPDQTVTRGQMAAFLHRAEPWL